MATAYDSREVWDRLALLLIAQPREGWESEFGYITRREIERLAHAERIAPPRAGSASVPIPIGGTPGR